jgi:hypothetical protein
MDTTSDEIAKDFLNAAAARAKLVADDAGVFCYAKGIVQMCAEVADTGGGRTRMMERCADAAEAQSTPRRDFAGMVVARCAELVEVPAAQPAPGEYLRQYFRVLDDWVDESELEFQRWSVDNPMGFMVRVEDNGHLSGEQNLGAVERYTESMHADFGDNNGVVAAFEAVHEANTPTPEAVKIWEDAMARARANAMEGLPIVPPVTFVPFTYISA